MSIGAFTTRSESETTLAPESSRVTRTKKSISAKQKSLNRSNVSRTPLGAIVGIGVVSDAAVQSRREAHRRRDEQTVGNTGQATQNLGGEPIPSNIRQKLESSFKANLGAVRVHSGTRAQTAARNLSARALTVGNNIFLGAGERTSDLSLMAHETTHVVQQQRGTAEVQTLGAFQNDSNEREARRSSESVMRGESFNIQGRAGAMSIQRLGLSDILDGLAELAANVPGFTLLTVIIGRNPINMRVVERNFTNILRGFMGLIPGGEILFQVLSGYRVVERIGQWTSRQLDALGFNYEYIRRRFTTFTDSLSWRDIFSPGDVWRRARDIFTEPINRITNFVSRLISQAIVWLKETFMEPLSNFCREIPGYTLVTVLLGRDPFTNAAVPRSALNVVRAFAEFIPGGTEKVNQLVESRALERAYTWFIEETQVRNLTWARFSGTFVSAWNSLRLEDILHPIDTLRRIIGMFRPLMSDLVGFAGAALMKLLELIFEAVMGAGGNRILAILKRARETFITIIRNPVGFLRNLLGAVGQGVRQFMTNILRHLRDGVIAWLTGPVARAGIQMPERWDVRGIIWFVLQILGLTWDRVRQKLVRLMGERAVGMLEAGFQLIQDIRQRGLVQALRDRVTEFFGQLRDAALGGIRSFIQQRLVMAGITQLLSLLNPVGAIIQAIIKTYTTIQFFIQRINQILDLVESVVNSIAAIASGAIGQAANFVERTMARTIPVILDFLARFIGLGDVGGHVQRTIRELQGRVDQMLDRAVDWIRTQAQRIGTAVVQAGVPQDPNERVRLAARAAVTAMRRLSGRRLTEAIITPVLGAIRLRYGLRSLEPFRQGGTWWVRAVINPIHPENSEIPENPSATPACQCETIAPTYSGGTRPTSVTVCIQGQRTREGSHFPRNPSWWSQLPSGVVWEKGHFLPSSGGGSGSQQNLIALTQTANGQMNGADQILRRARETAGACLTYRATAVYANAEALYPTSLSITIEPHPDSTDNTRFTRTVQNYPATAAPENACQCETIAPTYSGGTRPTSVTVCIQGQRTREGSHFPRNPSWWSQLPSGVVWEKGHFLPSSGGGSGSQQNLIALTQTANGLMNGADAILHRARETAGACLTYRATAVYANAEALYPTSLSITIEPHPDSTDNTRFSRTIRNYP